MTLTKCGTLHNWGNSTKSRNQTLDLENDISKVCSLFLYIIVCPKAAIQIEKYKYWQKVTEL